MELPEKLNEILDMPERWKVEEELGHAVLARVQAWLNQWAESDPRVKLRIVGTSTIIVENTTGYCVFVVSRDGAGVLFHLGNNYSVGVSLSDLPQDDQEARTAIERAIAHLFSAASRDKALPYRKFQSTQGPDHYLTKSAVLRAISFCDEPEKYEGEKPAPAHCSVCWDTTATARLLNITALELLEWAHS